MLLNHVYRGYGEEGTKNISEKISKYKTLRLTNNINLTINFLDLTEEKNERNLLFLTNYQKLLNGNIKKKK